MLRKSIQRDTILRTVMSTSSHPGADWVYDQVRKEIPNISLGTIYRDLKFLAESGAIQELDIPGGLSRFDGNTANHYHFRCEKCSRIFDLDLAVDHALETRVAEQTGFRINGHFLEFTGLCLGCQKQ